MEEAYIPVSCDFYDQLEAFSVLRTPCEVVFIQQESRVTVQGRIADLYVRDKVEYLKLDNGPEIRLDKIIHVNGVERVNFC